MSTEKISLSSFFVPEPEILTFPIGDTGAVYEIKTFIPYEEILMKIQWAILLITDSNGYISEPVKRVVADLVLCSAYTNLDFGRLELATIEQQEIFEMFDIVTHCNIAETVRQHANKQQVNFFYNTLDDTLKSILNYRNSVAGMVELIAAKSDALNQQLSDTMSDFNDPEKVGNILKIADLIKAKDLT